MTTKHQIPVQYSINCIHTHTYEVVVEHLTTNSHSITFIAHFLMLLWLLVSEEVGVVLGTTLIRGNNVPKKCFISRVSTRQKNQLQQQKSPNPTKFTFCSNNIFISFKQFLSKLFIQLSLSYLWKMLEAKEMESSADLVRKCLVLKFCVLFLKNQCDSPLESLLDIAMRK